MKLASGGSLGCDARPARQFRHDQDAHGEDVLMFIGIGTIVLIVIIVLVVLALRR